MEPLTIATTATALSIVLTTKVVEKVGQNLGEALCIKVNDFLDLLKKESPNIIEMIEETDQQALNSETVSNLHRLAQNNSKIAQSIEELVELSRNNSFPEIFNQNIQKAMNVAKNIDTIDYRGSTIINF